jgi:chemotaxis protein CheX
VTNSVLMQPFISSVSNVLSTMAGIECEPIAPGNVFEGSGPAVVAGVIGIAGNRLRGSLAVTFSRNCFLAIATEMLGEEVSDVDEDAAEMAGEIANMTMGGAKIALFEQGYDFELAVPTAIWGTEVVVKHGAQSAADVVCFQTPHGSFTLELCVIQD